MVSLTQDIESIGAKEALPAPVTVVIPLYNAADHIWESLDSVAAQTVPVQKVVIVDDGSSDGGADVAAGHPLQPRIIRQENQGPSKARNNGIRAVETEFIAFIDADDKWARNKLEMQFDLFRANPDLELCFGKIDFFWQDPDCDEAKAFKDHPRTNRVPGYIFPTLLARRSVFDRIGLIDENLRFGDAAEWTTRAMDAGINIELMDEVLLFHRMHGSNLTRQRSDSKKEFLHLLRDRMNKKRAVSGA